MQLAQLNIAKAKYALDQPQIKDFVDNLDIVNATAQSSDGFIWRLTDESGDATSIVAFDDSSIIVNMSVWTDVNSLKNFMFRTHHRDFMRRKAEWFVPFVEDSYVLWWIENNTIPTIEQAKKRLMHLRENGDSPVAFTFKSNFTALEYLATLDSEL